MADEVVDKKVGLWDGEKTGRSAEELAVDMVSKTTELLDGKRAAKMAE